MGTRASFFIGDPRDLDKREWLGCVAWDGYPDGDIGEVLSTVSTKEEFEIAINNIHQTRDDFASPKSGGWPFPWTDDLFLTDFTYAFFDNKVMVSRFYHGFIALESYLNASEKEIEEYNEREDPTTKDVPSPSKEWDQNQPDSIIYIAT